MSPPVAPTAAPAVASDVCTVDEVAAWLGVDRKTVYQAARRREIPCARLGRRFLLSRAQITAWLAGRVP
jgi:excisionase family DNA binding protein